MIDLWLFLLFHTNLTWNFQFFRNPEQAIWPKIRKIPDFLIGFHVFAGKKFGGGFGWPPPHKFGALPYRTMTLNFQTWNFNLDYTSPFYGPLVQVNHEVFWHCRDVSDARKLWLQTCSWPSIMWITLQFKQFNITESYRSDHYQCDRRVGEFKGGGYVDVFFSQ